MLGLEGIGFFTRIQMMVFNIESGLPQGMQGLAPEGTLMLGRLHAV
jgi:hypothetical protein